MSSENQEKPKLDSNFPFVVKYAAQVSVQVIDFMTKDRQQGPRKLVALNPATGEAYVIAHDLDALPKLSPEEANAVVEWQKMLHQKGALLGGNIVINPETGEIGQGRPPGPMPHGVGRQIIGG